LKKENIIVLLAVIAVGRREARNQWYFLYFSVCLCVFLDTHTEHFKEYVCVPSLCLCNSFVLGAGGKYKIFVFYKLSAEEQ